MKRLLLLLLATTALAQNPITSTSTITISTPTLPAATSDSVTKDGHYRFVFDDPANKWRCYVTAYTETNPRNAFRSDVGSFTVVCVNRDAHPEPKQNP